MFLNKKKLILNLNYYISYSCNVQVDIDLLVRKNFATGVTRGKNELKLKDPALTPVSGLIENAVIEVI